MVEKRQVPQWLSSKISEEGIKKIAESVRQAEEVTSGEIVPVVLKRSSTVGHVPLVVFFLLLTVYLFVDVPELLEEELIIGWWWTALSIAFLWGVSRVLASVDWLQRILTPKLDQKQQVLQRAELEFYESNIKKTVGATGVLLFVSLMERQAVVLSDKAIAEKLPKDVWQGIVDGMITEIKNGRLSEGFCRGITDSGELLAQHFPIAPDDVNELPNGLVVKEF